MSGRNLTCICPRSPPIPPPPPKGLGRAAGASAKILKAALFQLFKILMKRTVAANYYLLQGQGRASQRQASAFAGDPKLFHQNFGYKSKTKTNGKHRVQIMSWVSGVRVQLQLSMTNLSIVSLIFKPSVRQVAHCKIQIIWEINEKTEVIEDEGNPLVINL